MKIFNVFFLLSFVTIVSCGDVLEFPLQLSLTKGDVKCVLIEIGNKLNIPIIYEGGSEKIQNIELSSKTRPLKDILDDICSKLSDHQYNLINGVVVISQNSFLKDNLYPFTCYKLSFNLKTNNLSEYLKTNKFFDTLSEKRIFYYGRSYFNYSGLRSFNENFENKCLRDILIQFNHSSRSLVVCYKITTDANKVLHKIIEKNKKIDTTVP